MDIGEACKIAKVTAKRPKCNPKTTKYDGWKAVIDGIKGGKGDADVLKNNMVEAGIAAPEEPAKLRKGWDLFDCTRTRFPCQTHHLIPEKQLPDHKITLWLTDKPKSKCRHKKYELAKDTNYDTNGAKNGYFLPFASTTHQWKSARSARRKNLICFELMRRTRLQLHQSRHSRTKDYGEDLEIETAPYKKQVDEFLKEIHGEILDHVDQCKNGCKDKSSPKKKVKPLLATVRLVEQASFLLMNLTRNYHIHVSGRAGAYSTRFFKGKRIRHPSKPLLTR